MNQQTIELIIPDILFHPENKNQKNGQALIRETVNLIQDLPEEDEDASE